MIGNAYLPIAIPLAGLALDILCQLFISRIPLKLGHVRRQFISFGTGLVFVILGELLLRPTRGSGRLDELCGAVQAAASYAFLGFLFFNSINANLSSLRIRILKELSTSDSGLSMQKLIEKYGSEEIVRARITRLAAGGQIALGDSRAYARPGGVSTIAKIFDLLAAVLLGRSR